MPLAYTITAENEVGQVQKTVPRLPVISFNASCVDSAGDPSTLSWESQCATSCEINQGIGIVPLSGSAAVVPGDIPAIYTLTCSNGGGSRQATKLVKFCEDNPIEPKFSITASPGCAYSFYDQPITLTWETIEIDVQSCEIEPDVGSVEPSGSTVVTPSQPTIYTLRCTKPDDDVISTQSRYNGLSINYLYPRAIPNNINPGESATLYWYTSCATAVSFDQGIGALDPVGSGSIVVTPPELPITYTLTAIDGHDTITQSVTVFPSRPTVAFNVSPSMIKAGESATLTWSTEQATSCNISPDIGEVALNGTIEVQPEQNTTYTLTATGSGGTTRKTASVTYLRPSAEISANPEVLDEGESSTLQWVFSNADVATVNQGIGEVQLGGSIVVNPDEVTIYTIDVTGPGGSASDSVTVSFFQPTVTISVDPLTIMEGDSTVLTWHAEHAAGCVIEPYIGAVALNGSRQISPGITRTYTVTASGRGGEASAQTTITVINPPSITLIEPDGNENKVHKTFTIQWSDRDYDSDATIALYYDINNSGMDGTLIAAGISENPDGQYDRYVWDTTTIPAGAYYVYAVIDDGTNAPVVDYSDGVITIDHSVTDEFKITASDGTASDQFGNSVSISGDYAVVGAHSADGGGAAYVYKLEGSTWVEQFKLTADDGALYDNFGESVSISGDTVIVGAPAANESNGAAYVFKRDGEIWTEQATLIAGDGEAWDEFGGSVSLSGNTVVVGALGNGDGLGAAFVFGREGSTWVEQTKLTASDGILEDRFGGSVSIDGDAIIVGASSNENNTGASYIFRLVGSDWVEEAKLVPSDAVEWGRFGRSVSIDGNYAIVGNYGLIEAMVEGTVYIFMYDGSNWSEQRKIGMFGVAGAGEYFGDTVAINGDMVAVGESNIRNEAGAVYLFERNGFDWVLRERLTPSDGADNDYFGCSVALSNDHVIVGSYRDDDLGSSSGSAYIYPLFSVSISANPEIIHIGGEISSTMLSWTSRDADSVLIDPGIGSVSESGSLRVYPQQTTTYTITGTKEGITITDSVTVHVIDSTVLPTVEMSASPETIFRGASAAISWSASG